MSVSAKNRSQESKDRIAESCRGRKWYTDGINETLSHICPEGWHLGRKDSVYLNNIGVFKKGHVNSLETRRKMSVAAKNRSLELRKRISESLKKRPKEVLDKIAEKSRGRTWYTDGVHETLSRVCPEGWHRGKLKTNLKWYTNDIDQVMSDKCPDGWHEGRLPRLWYNDGVN